MLTFFQDNKKQRNSPDVGVPYILVLLRGILGTLGPCPNSHDRKDVKRGGLEWRALVCFSVGSCVHMHENRIRCIKMTEEVD